MIKLVIFGSREYWPSNAEITGQVSSFLINWGTKLPDEVICGMAQGADAAGNRWAKDNSIMVRSFRPDWSKGPMAGYTRNHIMAQHATHGLGFWDGESRGTANMASHLLSLNKPVKVVLIKLGPRIT